MPRSKLNILILLGVLSFTQWLPWNKHLSWKIAFLGRDHSGLWQKKKNTLKKSTQEKKAHFSKKAPILQTKSTFGAEKKHLVNIILLTKSKNDGEKKFYFHPNFFWIQSSF